MELQEFTLDFDPKSFQKLLKETCDIITRTHSSLEKRKVFSAQSPDQVASLFEYLLVLKWVKGVLDQ